MFNPFEGVMSPVEYKRNLIGRQDIYQRLSMKIRMQQNVVLQGVQGSGKTSVLKTYFDEEYRIHMAKDEKTLVITATYPTYLECDGVFDFFADRIIDGVRILKRCGLEEEYQKILDEITDVKRDKTSSDAKLRGVLSVLHDYYGYRILLVMDNFEMFTSSTDINAAHHGLLRSLIDDMGMQFIVATDFDMTRDSLNGEIKGGSFLTQKFSGNEILVGGFSQDETMEYLKIWLQDSGCEFTNSEVEKIHAISGGIPVLVRSVAYYALEEKVRLNRELLTADFDRVVAQVVTASRPILENWYKYLTKDQMNTIQYLLDNMGYRCDAVTTKKFCDRGVFKVYEELDETGVWRKIAGEYDFNSVILEEFSRDKEALEEILRRNQPEVKPDKITINVGAGGNVTLGDTNVNNNYVQVEQLTVSGLLSILDDESALQQYAARIDEKYRQICLPAVNERNVIGINGGTEEAVSQFGDELAGKFDASEEEKQSLSARFERVRGIRPEITDEIMGMLGEQAQIYLKIAVVVEDALSVLHNTEMEDFSAKLVMYGKVLEQVLRDSFYDLFSSDIVISSVVYDGKKTFSMTPVKKTLIGNYVYMIGLQQDWLATLSAQHNIQMPEGTTARLSEWRIWWADYVDWLETARDLRNMTDHAGTEVQDKHSRQMCDCLFGTGDIIRNSQIGKRLWNSCR